MTQDKPVLVQVREALQLAQHTFCETHQRMIFSGQIKPERSKYAEALALLDAFIESVPETVPLMIEEAEKTQEWTEENGVERCKIIDALIRYARILNNAVRGKE